MKFFIIIHSRITLQYFNSKRENKFEKFVSAIIAAERLLGGNDIDPHLNCHDHSDICLKAGLIVEHIPISSAF